MKGGDRKRSEICRFVSPSSDRLEISFNGKKKKKRSFLLAFPSSTVMVCVDESRFNVR